MLFGLPVETVLVFCLIGATIALFVTEVVPPDVTAIGVVVALVVLEPWTGITPTEGLSGFSNPATTASCVSSPDRVATVRPLLWTVEGSTVPRAAVGRCVRRSSTGSPSRVSYPPVMP